MSIRAEMAAGHMTTGRRETPRPSTRHSKPEDASRKRKARTKNAKQSRRRNRK